MHEIIKVKWLTRTRQKWDMMQLIFIKANALPKSNIKKIYIK